jgi:serine/threonine protein kinase
MLDRLNAEITIHHQVKHPNIVELLNCFCDDKYVYLILELCAKGDLEHYLQEKKTLSEHESMRYRSKSIFLLTKIRLF